MNGIALKDRKAVEQSARVALAALAVAGIVHQRDQGYDLRSRCLLVPDGALALEAVRADGSTESFSLTVAEADKLVTAAESVAAKAGMAWQRQPIQLKPAPKLAALVKKSRELAMAGAAEEV
jgi:CRISPR-associated protein Csb1